MQTFCVYCLVALFMISLFIEFSSVSCFIIIFTINLCTKITTFYINYLKLRTKVTLQSSNSKSNSKVNERSKIGKERGERKRENKQHRINYSIFSVSGNSFINYFYSSIGRHKDFKLLSYLKSSFFNRRCFN